MLPERWTNTDGRLGLKPAQEPACDGAPHQDPAFRRFLNAAIEPETFRDAAVKMSRRRGLTMSLELAESPDFQAWVRKAITDLSGTDPPKQ